MRIGRIYFPVTTLGYGRRIGIWVSGCSRCCPNCISPELQNPENGKTVAPEELFQMMEKYIHRADGITISGGEPLEQAEELYRLMRMFCQRGIDDILLYSGFSIEELRQKQDTACGRCIEMAAAVVLEPYIEELNDGIGLRGSSNQKVIINRYQERYKNLASCKRQIQAVITGKNMLFIGIPERGRIHGANNNL